MGFATARLHRSIFALNADAMRGNMSQCVGVRDIRMKDIGMEDRNRLTNIERWKLAAEKNFIDHS